MYTAGSIRIDFHESADFARDKGLIGDGAGAISGSISPGGPRTATERDSRANIRKCIPTNLRASDTEPDRPNLFQEHKQGGKQLKERIFGNLGPT